MTGKLTIENINGKWHVNGKVFADMSETERNVLSKFIAEYNIELENNSVE